MATSKTFFGLRSGSTKSFTFQIVNGKQVTKERVQNVKNPNTRNQIMQRMKLAPALRVYRALSSVLDHSFEGVPYGAKSRQHFLKLAMKRTDGPYMKKGDTTLPISAYQIASGSLPRFYPTEANYELGTFDNAATLETISWGDVSKKIIEYYGYKDGDELTLVSLGNAETYIVSIIIDTTSETKLKGIPFIDKAEFNMKAGKVLTAAENVAIIASRNENGIWKRSDAFLYNGGVMDDAPEALVEALNSYGVVDNGSFGSSRILNRSNTFEGVLKIVEVDNEEFIIGIKSIGNKVVKGIFTTTGTKDGYLIRPDRTPSVYMLSSQNRLLKNYPNVWKWNNFADSTPQNSKPKPAGPVAGEEAHG